MTNTILMISLVIIFVIIIFWKSRIDFDKKSILSVSDSNIFKGIFSIIILLVHIPERYGNGIQNIIGSFASVGVVFFFLTSAYGLQYSKEKDKEYLNNFWKKRLPKILLPALIINIILNVLKKYVYKDFKITLFTLININRWVVILLLLYFIYYIINKLKMADKQKDIIIISFIVIMSFVGYLTPIKLFASWSIEALGFPMGIIIYRYNSKILNFFKSRYKLNSALFIFLSLIIGLMYLKFKQTFFWGEYILKILLNTTIIIMILQINVKISLKNNIIDFLGKISYEIYLFQYIIFLLFRIVSVSIPSAIVILVMILLIILGATVIKKIDDVILKKVFYQK